jgi:hypothetical protein
VNKGRVASVKPQPASPPSCDQKKRGRKAVLEDVDPGEVEQYLEKAGKAAMDESLAKGLAWLMDDALASTHCDHSELQKLMKPICDHFRKLHTEIISLQWKLKKRSVPNERAIDVLGEHRSFICDIWTVCLEIKKDPDDITADKLVQWMDGLSSRLQDAWDAPLLFQARQPRTACGRSCHLPLCLVAAST